MSSISMQHAYYRNMLAPPLSMQARACLLSHCAYVMPMSYMSTVQGANEPTSPWDTGLRRAHT